eukprot:1181273-Prorocentrum_minimum.AAC.5
MLSSYNDTILLLGLFLTGRFSRPLVAVCSRSPRESTPSKIPPPSSDTTGSVWMSFFTSKSSASATLVEGCAHTKLLKGVMMSEARFTGGSCVSHTRSTSSRRSASTDSACL